MEFKLMMNILDAGYKALENRGAKMIDPVEQDLNRYLNERDYDKWFEKNEEDLIADFFERTGLTIEEDEAGFKAYVERKWQDSAL